VVLEDAESLGETGSEERNKNIGRVQARRARRKCDERLTSLWKYRIGEEAASVLPFLGVQPSEK